MASNHCCSSSAKGMVAWGHFFSQTNNAPEKNCLLVINAFNSSTSAGKERRLFKASLGYILSSGPSQATKQGSLKDSKAGFGDKPEIGGSGV